MQKLLSILLLLFISVVTTACINNFAVQELNNKAKEYLDKGDTQTAICRLKSSLDLDNTVFQPPHFPFLPLKRLLRLVNLLKIRQISRTVHRQQRSVLSPVNERCPRLLLQRLDRLAHRALGITQKLRRLRKAPRFYDFTENSVSRYHMVFSISLTYVFIIIIHFINVCLLQHIMI